MRPYAYEFLDYVSKKYEIIVFCNGSDLYCKPVLDYIEKERLYFAHRAYGSYVLFENPTFSVKYYDFLMCDGRDSNNSVIVDSHVGTFCLRIANGVPVLPYSDTEKGDEELIGLAKCLDELAISANISAAINCAAINAI